MRVILKSVVFEGFQSISRRAEVDFSGLQTSVIYGDNGCGKTTFLKLLHAVLCKEESVLAKENVTNIKISIIDSADDLLYLEIKKRINPDRLTDNDLAEGYDWSEFDASELSESTSLSLGVERGVSTQAIPIESQDIFKFLSNHNVGMDLPRIAAVSLSERLAVYLNRQSLLRNRQSVLRSRGKNNELQLERDHSFLQNIKISNIEALLLERFRLARDYASEKIQNALFDTLALAIEATPDQFTLLTIPDNLSEQIIAGKERIIEALVDGPENNFKQRIINILQGLHGVDDVGIITGNSMLCQLILNMIKELKLEKQLLNSINVFIETFNEFLGDRKELSIEHDGIYLNVAGQKYGMDALSSGERHLFTFLALVIIVARDRDFLIIDEPEISLNAQWQRNLVGLLERLAPDTQIIVASHSPILAKGQPAALVELNPEEYKYA